MLESFGSFGKEPGQFQLGHDISVAPNGAVYVARTDHLELGGCFHAPGAVGYPMPKERSLDVDTEFDVAIVDFLLNRPNREAGQRQQ